jgi:hypothetical protein
MKFKPDARARRKGETMTTRNFECAVPWAA